MQYRKADLTEIPSEDRTFFFMVTALANEIQMLSKTVAVLVGSDDSDQHLIEKQGNSAFAMLMVRMLSGRLTEGWKTISLFSKRLKTDYEPLLSDESREALRSIRSYFNPGKDKKPLIRTVRDNVAFHSLREPLEAAFEGLASDAELGEYMCTTMGNTLYYTAEVLHYQILSKLAGVDDEVEALRIVLKDTLQLSNNFNDTIYGFALVFCERFLPDALKNLANEKELVDVCPFDDLRLEFFSGLPLVEATPQ
jgi:hypothetical protein